MTAIWIVSVLFALVFAAILSGAALGRLLERIYRSRLRGRAARAVARGSRDQLLAEVEAELERVRGERSEVEAELERQRSGRAILRKQDLFGRICQLEDWQQALRDVG